MCKNRKRGYSKGGQYVEVHVPSRSTYDEIIKECVKVVQVPGSSRGELALFRVDGTLIPKQYFSTLFNYLKSMKKSAGQLKLGIGHGPKVCTNCDS